MSQEQDVITLCRAARAAAPTLAGASTDDKNTALRAGAEALRTRQGELLSANVTDLAASEGESKAFIDRLTLTPERVEDMATGLEQIAELPDPVGEKISSWTRPNGLEIAQVRVPLGVIGIIYESRPNVTADAAGLCLKSGNAVVLRGGREAFRTNCLIADILGDALGQATTTIPREALALIRTTDRAAVRTMLEQSESIDVIIPRGGEDLIRAITESSKIPVIQHFAGICQLYVDRDADLDLAERIGINGKTQRPGVCNAIENLLVHRDVAPTFLPRIATALEAAGVELRGCEQTRQHVPTVVAATDADWGTEYLDKILSIRVVDSVDDAVTFIRTHGSGLADAIITKHEPTADRFVAAVDSSAVFVNASTRFNDGFEFGFGAEIGISTNRLHARGPMGLRELTTYKYVVRGTGQIRE